MGWNPIVDPFECTARANELNKEQRREREAMEKRVSEMDIFRWKVDYLMYKKRVRSCECALAIYLG